MNVVHIISGLGRGGAEMMLWRLITARERQGPIHHTVISLTTKGAYGPMLEARGITVHALGMSRLRHLIPAFLALVRLLRDSRPDLVHTWMYHADLFGGLAAHAAGHPPVIWGVHSLDLRRSGSMRTVLIQKLCAWVSSWVPNTILCVADASRQAHIDVGYDPGRFVVIPNGFDVSQRTIAAERVTTFRQGCGLQPGDLVIGCVGRFNPAKDHHNFVEAATQVGRRHPETRFLMIGRGLDRSNTTLMTWIGSSGFAERFILLGERDDIPIALAAMDIFCSSSRTEAFPLVVGEAMVLARACVVTNVGDTGLLVGDTAVVVERENSAALAQGLEELLVAGPTGREQLGRRAQERVIREFNLEHTLERTEALYARILGQQAEHGFNNMTGKR